MAQGITIFRTLLAALQAGYQVLDKTDEGYLVRQRTERGWALARVICNAKD